MSSQSAAHTMYPVLPANAGISYLNEGAANVVYHISIKVPTPPPSVLESYEEGTPPPTETEEFVEVVPDLDLFDNTLLRLRKDLPTTIPCLYAQESWKRLIEPLFNPEQLVHQSLVQLKPGAWIERLNEGLRKSEANHPVEARPNLNPVVGRPVNRRQVYLADDDYGLLITDMTSRSPEDNIVEFKPKWLDQSPSAPATSKRCRTCANTARINAEKAHKGEKLRKSFCPLDFLSSDPQILLKIAEVLLHSGSSQLTTDHALTATFVQWLQENRLLSRLRELQISLDALGPLKADVTAEQFRVVMTLRDVTVYIRFPSGPTEGIPEVEARIGDLDVKSQDKGTYWVNLERQLINEGWYEGKERSEDTQPLTCSISRPGYAYAG